MTTRFDYSASAGLYFSKSLGRKRSMAYRRFDSAAAAIEFAVEQLGAATLQLATLEVDEERFERGAIRRLYDATDYPLVRNAAAA